MDPQSPALCRRAAGQLKPSQLYTTGIPFVPLARRLGGFPLHRRRREETVLLNQGDLQGCLRNPNRWSPPPKEIASAYELTARAASPCAVSRRPSQPRQTSRSTRRPGRLVPIFNRTSAAAFT